MDFSLKTSSHIDNFDNCRCCLKHQGLSDIFMEYTFITDEKEVYETILKDTFNIQINTYDFIGNKICDACISKLKDAANFRRQVINAEATLERQNEFNIMDFETPKQEILDNGFDDCEYDDASSIDGDSCMKDSSEAEKIIGKILCDKEVVIKLEPLIQTEASPKAKRKKDTNGTTLNMKVKTVPNDVRRKRIRNKESNEKLTEMIYNTIQLVTNSNMIIFISKKTKFACYYCHQSYLDIKILRKHYQEHSTDKFIRINLKKSKGRSYKNVDISDLTCNKCQTKCQNLTDLQSHLTTHGVVFKSADNLLVAYKLEEGNRCLVCNADFKTFCRLSIHMNTHSTNNVCEICGEAYINRISLRNHISMVHKEKNCSICLIVFPNTAAMKKHMRSAHKKQYSKRYCMKCEMTFQYTHQLKEHMIVTHGVKRELVKCEYCGKIFPPESLRTHIRSVHIGERNHQCGSCEMRFFTSCDKRRHERIHKDEKSFSCEICDVKFKTKDSMRRHIRRLHHSKNN